MAKTMQGKKTTAKTKARLAENRKGKIGCGRVVVADYTRQGEEVYGLCGDYFCGDKVLCEPCTHNAVRRFPQGWSSYPGDVCRHGVYVGGCGEDFMCHYCEDGIDPEPEPFGPPKPRFLDSPYHQTLTAQLEAGRITPYVFMDKVCDYAAL